MKLITPQSLAATAADRWKANYFRGGEWGEVCLGDSREIYEALAALGESPDPDDVDRIIGNHSWTRRNCNECGSYERQPVVEVGQEPDYESSTAWLCFECLTRAFAIIPVEAAP